MFLQKHRNGVYYFRWVYPSLLQKILGKQELLKSLRTTSKIQALARSKVYYMFVDRFKEIQDSYDRGLITDDEYSEQCYKNISGGYFTYMLEGIDEYSPSDLAEVKIAREKIANGLRMIKTGKTNLKGEYDSGATIQQKVIKLIESKPDLYFLKNWGDSLKVQQPATYSRYINDLVDLFHCILAKLDKKLDPSLAEPMLPSFMQEQRQTSVSVIEVIKEPDSISLRELFVRLLDHKKDKHNQKEIRRNEMLYYFSVLSILIGDKSINKIKPVDIRTCFDSYKKLPRRNTKPYNKMTVEQMVGLTTIPDNHRVSHKTVKEAYKLLTSMFTYAVEYDFLDKSPMVAIKFDQSSKMKRGAYSISQVRQLLVKVTEEKQIWKHWILRLAVYAGARAGELTQLRKQDIRQEAETGIHFLAITDSVDEDEDDDEDYYGGRIRVLKTDNALRMIPIHPSLIDLGFLGFVKTCSGDLFPELKSSKKVTSWFTRFKLKAGMPARDEYNLPLVFHSFRHSFVTQVRGSATVSDALLQQVVGHKISDVGITSSYTGRYSLSQLLPVIEAIKY